MDDIAENLKNIKILDNNDIIVFKNHICKKYPENTSAKNAKILSDAIHKVISRNLEGLPEDFKLLIKTATLKNTLGSGKDLITLYDIFNSCLVEETLKSNFKEHLAKWITLHIKAKIEVEELNLYLENRNVNRKNTVEFEKTTYVDDEEKFTDSALVNIIKPNLTIFLNYFTLNRRIALIVMCIAIIPLYMISKNFSFNINKDKQKEETYIVDASKGTSTSGKYANSHLPEYMRYKVINQENLKSFLDKRNSFLSKEPYFSTIISVSKEFNLNPIVLFSITGQEQNFVPKDNDNASKIANNPFNVFHSWKNYNTNIRDSSSIAARTVINLLQNMPENEDPFLWIGKKYAEDKYWGTGVKSIFKELNSCVN